MKSAAFISEKGGVGKTTSALNVAAAMAKKGLEVLIVDADPQGNASHVLLRGEKPRRPTLHEVLVGQSEAETAIVSTVLDGVSLIPSDASLADIKLFWPARSDANGDFAWRWKGWGTVSTMSWSTPRRHDPC